MSLSVPSTMAPAAGADTNGVPTAAEEMIASLAAQVAALIDERDDLALALEQSLAAAANSRLNA